MFASEEYSDR